MSVNRLVVQYAARRRPWSARRGNKRQFAQRLIPARFVPMRVHRLSAPLLLISPVAMNAAAADRPLSALHGRLHTHALHGICSFLSLCDLHMLSCADRAWQRDIVHDLPRFGVSCAGGPSLSEARLSAMLRSRSPLHRHLQALGTGLESGKRVDLPHGELMAVCERLPHLRQLCCRPFIFDASDWAALRFPARLRVLRVFSHTSPSASIAAILTAAASLEELEELELERLYPTTTPEIRLAALQRAPSLCRFKAHWVLPARSEMELSSAQLNDLRALAHLDDCDAMGFLSPECFTTLLRQPFEPRWRKVTAILCDATAAALPTLRHLTELNVRFTSRASCTSFAFLAHLPALTSLALDMASAEPGTHAALLDAAAPAADGGALLHGIVCFKLSLYDYTSAQMSVLLSAMPSLRALTLEHSLDVTGDLSFLLSSASLRANLTELSIVLGKSTANELLSTMLQLHSLQRLLLHDASCPDLTIEQQRRLRMTLPRLQELQCHATIEAMFG